MDEDVEQMSREQLVTEVKRLRQGIRQHRDCTGHELCWHHPALWALLPDATDPLPTVPDWPQFLQGCIRYRQSLDAQAPDAPRTSESFGGRACRAEPAAPVHGSQRGRHCCSDTHAEDICTMPVALEPCRSTTGCHTQSA